MLGTAAVLWASRAGAVWGALPALAGVLRENGRDIAHIALVVPPERLG
jgi:hypothetical protein